MAGAKVPLTFRIYKGSSFLGEQTVSQPVIKVGKLSSSHLRLDDDSVSRMHAVIEVTAPGEISIIDLGSAKGTLVNGQKVNKAKIQSGDVLQLGDIRLELVVNRVEEEEDDQPTRVNVNAVPVAEPPAPAPATVATRPVAPPPAAPAAPPSAAPRAAPAAAPPRAAAQPAAPLTPATAPPRTAVPPLSSPGVSAPARPVAPVAPLSQPAMPLGSPLGGGAGPLGGEPIDEIGARAVEIAAMLGDSVVAVKHCMNPRSGKVTPITYGLFGAGAVLLLMSLLAFSVGVNTARKNKEALHHWTEVERKPLHEFRPYRISLVFDWMAFGGAIGGMLAMTTGLLRLHAERQSPYFRIGRAETVEFPLDGAPTEAFPLVAPSGDDFVCNFAAGMEGELTVEGQSTSLAELQGQGRARPSSEVPGALELSMPASGRVRIRVGQTNFLLSAVPRPRRFPVPFLANVETAVLGHFGGAAVVILGFMALLHSIPPDPKSLSLDLIGADGRLSRVETKATEDPKQEEEKSENDGAESDSGGTGTKMALDEGKMGKKESTRAAGQYAMKNQGADPQLAKQQAIDQAQRSGILGVIQRAPGGAFASITGTGDFSSGLDDRDVFGGLVGNEVGEMAGGWGFGVSGVGPGGGGTGWGTIGTGRYGTIGHGSGTGSGYGTGSGRGGMRGRQAKPPEVRIGNATATGDLDKNIIRRYIRRKLPQITHCYEKQLLVKPNIRGTIVTEFQISPQGAVLSVKATGMGDSDVENCVADAIRTIAFPKPKGGGLVNVRYPFTFQPSG